jgi:diguanylate cyclase (GGDEF)-like protein
MCRKLPGRAPCADEISYAPMPLWHYNSAEPLTIRRIATMKILLADDTLSIRMVVRKYIEDAGHEVVLADDGDEAFRRFEEETPDLVLLDVVMPKMNGYKTARHIRSLCQEREDWIPIVFLTAMASEQDLVKGIEAGGDDYLIKPISQIVLNAKLTAMQRIAEMRRQLQQANAQLRRLSEIDGLTGLSNRRRFDEVYDRAYERALLMRRPLSLLMMDVDHFKAYNDCYGHQAGDECLKKVAAAIQRSARRPSDLAARYGGEEFVVLLPDADLDYAREIAEETRRAMAAMNLAHERSATAPHVTLSVGAIAFMPSAAPPPDASEILRLADQNLYLAKKNGRDRVESQRVTQSDSIVHAAVI